VVFNVRHLKSEQFAHPQARCVKQHDGNAMHCRAHWRPRLVSRHVRRSKHSYHLLGRHNDGTNVGLRLGHGKGARDKERGFRSRTKEAEPSDNLLRQSAGNSPRYLLYMST
jgi:hypothetical protein